jgi:fibronectin-binding autotransporter adhesin
VISAHIKRQKRLNVFLKNSLIIFFFRRRTMFTKKVSVLAVLAVIVLAANVSFGDWTWFHDTMSDNSWTNSANWDNGLPGMYDDAGIAGTTATGAILNTGETGYAYWMHVADNGSPSGSKVTVNGGTLAVTDHLLLGEEGWGAGQQGTLQVDAGTVNTVLLMCGGGRFGGGSHGTLLVNGGNVNIAWDLSVGGGYAGVDNAGEGGHIQLDGGLITLAAGANSGNNGGLIMSSTGSLDITGGALSLNGVITDIATLANGGSITAYGGTGTFVYDYSVEGRTTITAIPEPATLALIGLGVLITRRKRA